MPAFDAALATAIDEIYQASTVKGLRPPGSFTRSEPSSALDGGATTQGPSGFVAGAKRAGDAAIPADQYLVEVPRRLPLLSELFTPGIERGPRMWPVTWDTVCQREVDFEAGLSQEGLYRRIVGIFLVESRGSGTPITVRPAADFRGMAAFPRPAYW